MNKFDNLVFFGAGDRVSIKKLKNIAKKIVLIDGCKNIVSSRVNEAKKYFDVEILRKVVSSEPGLVNFYEYSNSRFNGIFPVSTTQESLFKSLRLLSDSEVYAEAMGDVLDSIGLLSGSNLLVIDLPSETINFESLPLDCFSSILSSYDVLKKHELVDDSLYQQESMPEFIRHIFDVNYYYLLDEKKVVSRKLENSNLKAQLNEKEVVISGLFEKINELEDRVVLFEDMAVANNRLDEKLSKILECLDTKETSDRDFEVFEEAVSKRLDFIESGVNTFDKSFKDIKESLSKDLESLQGLVFKRIDNSIQQIESYVSLDRFISEGRTGLNYHGWPLSTDIALYLINRITSEKYDQIVEFGSGTSTCLFAKAIESNTKDDNVLINLNKLVTFEHNSTYFDKTKELLEQKNLHDYVDLKYTPLTAQSEGDRGFKYYSCDTVLAELAKNSGTNSLSKMLVLVDGPPAMTCDLARYPGLPKIIELWPAAIIDFILDDFNRVEEKEVFKAWENYLKDNNIRYEVTKISCEKGALLIRVIL